MTSTEKYFETLELPPGASLDQIKQAYRDLAQIWHPDRYAHNPRLRGKAEERFKAINEAYQNLVSASRSWQGAEAPPPRPPATDSRASTEPSTPKPPTAVTRPPAKRHWGGRS